MSTQISGRHAHPRNPRLRLPAGPRKVLIAAFAALAATAAAIVPATADHIDPVEFNDAGPIDLSDATFTTAKQVGSVELGPGLWEIGASVRLVVGDPETEPGKSAADQKNSQGCGLYADGVKLGGAGGSSGWPSGHSGPDPFTVWTAFEGGKDLTLDEWHDGVAFQPTVDLLVLTSSTVVLECFIDASHSGVTEADREDMEATDVSILATFLSPHDGEPGQDGSDGSDGEDGTDGTDGADGSDGQNGADGSDGTDGENVVTIPTPTRINTGR